jgi:hypothetical protein
MLSFSSNQAILTSAVRGLQGPPGASDLYVTPLEYEAVGDGTTDDTEAVELAFAAAQTAKKPLLFPAGYTFLTDTLDVSGNDWHIIIDRGCTVKMKSDGGVENTGGLFFISGNRGTIELYGTLNGNRSQQSYAYNAIGDWGLINADDGNLSDFVLKGGGIGLMTNCRWAFFRASGCGAITIDGIRCTDGNPTDATNNLIYLCIFIHEPTDTTVIRNVNISDSPTSGIYVSKFTAPRAYAQVLIENCVVDWRGCDLIEGGTEPSIGYLAFECFAHAPDVNLVNCTVFCEADSIDTNCLVDCFSHGSTRGCRVFGGTNVNGARAANASVGIEIGHMTSTHTDFILEDCAFGIAAYGSNTTVKGIIKNATTTALRVDGDGFIATTLQPEGAMDIDIVCIDCGNSSVQFTPTIDIRQCGASGEGVVRVKAHCIYENSDFNVYALNCLSTVAVNLHDSIFENRMAGDREVSVHIAGPRSSVSNCTFIGKTGSGIPGTAIYGTGDGLRINDNYFFSYEYPWDTGSGTHALITGNQMETVTNPAGTTDGTDTLANNIDW